MSTPQQRDNARAGIVVVTLEQLLMGSPFGHTKAKPFDPPAHIRGRTREAMKRIWDAAFPSAWQIIIGHTLNAQSGLTHHFRPGQGVIIDKAVRLTGVRANHVHFHWEEQ